MLYGAGHGCDVCSCCVSDVQEPKTVLARKYTLTERHYDGGRLVVKPDAAAMPYANADQNGLVAGLCETKIERSKTEKCVVLLVWCRWANVLTQ